MDCELAQGEPNNLKYHGGHEDNTPGKNNSWSHRVHPRYCEVGSEGKSSNGCDEQDKVEQNSTRDVSQCFIAFSRQHFILLKHHGIAYPPWRDRTDDHD